MAEAMEEVGGDRFLFSMPNGSRRTTAEIAMGSRRRCSSAG
jgi:hypothetical protein